MKRVVIIFLFLFVCLALEAQSNLRYEIVDSLVFTSVSPTDDELEGKSIFNAIPQCVKVNHSSAISAALRSRIADNSGRKVQGFRIRIYFDNAQNSRTASEGILNRFRQSHPDIPSYRTFTSPYFKVTVGDFRTRSEALALLKEIQREFPAAFIVREPMRFPSSTGETAFVIDTLKVRRIIGR